MDYSTSVSRALHTHTHMVINVSVLCAVSRQRVHAVGSVWGERWDDRQTVHRPLQGNSEALLSILSINYHSFLHQRESRTITALRHDRTDQYTWVQGLIAKQVNFSSLLIAPRLHLQSFDTWWHRQRWYLRNSVDGRPNVRQYRFIRTQAVYMVIIPVVLPWSSIIHRWILLTRSGDLKH